MKESEESLTYVVLIGEHQQLARHLLCLEDVERRQALGDGEAVVQFAVDDLGGVG